MNKPLLDSKDILRATNDVIAGIRSELNQLRKQAADDRLVSVNQQIERLAKRKLAGGDR